jgi:hypothetical protein
VRFRVDSAGAGGRVVAAADSVAAVARGVDSTMLGVGVGGGSATASTPARIAALGTTGPREASLTGCENARKAVTAATHAAMTPPTSPARARPRGKGDVSKGPAGRVASTEGLRIERLDPATDPASFGDASVVSVGGASASSLAAGGGELLRSKCAMRSTERALSGGPKGASAFAR